MFLPFLCNVVSAFHQGDVGLNLCIGFNGACVRFLGGLRREAFGSRQSVCEVCVELRKDRASFHGVSCLVDLGSSMSLGFQESSELYQSFSTNFLNTCKHGIRHDTNPKHTHAKFLQEILRVLQPVQRSKNPVKPGHQGHRPRLRSPAAERRYTAKWGKPTEASQ